MSGSLTEQQLAELPEYLDDDQAGGGAVTSPQPGVLRFAQMTGSSIAARDAAVWVTDFLNAAYYRRPDAGRDVDDLRLAFCVLTTYWYRKPGHGRLHLADLPAFHRAFGQQRFATGDSRRGTLSRAALSAARSASWVAGSRPPMGMTPGEAGGSPSRRRRSGPPMTRIAG